MASSSNYSSTFKDWAGDYAQLRSLPALLGAVFSVATLYQFGGISTVDLTWISYTLTTQHAVWVSIAVFGVAFASSETRQFENYEQWEQLTIGLGVLATVGVYYVPAIEDMILMLGDPLGYQVAFLVSLVGYAVAVR